MLDHLFLGHLARNLLKAILLHLSFQEELEVFDDVVQMLLFELTVFLPVIISIIFIYLLDQLINIPFRFQ